MEAMGRFVQKSLQEGSLVDTGGLLPSKDGFRIRLAKGSISVTDGPFAEAKEVIGGYWMIQVKSKEEAIEWARRCPASANDVIEIRHENRFEQYDIFMDKPPPLVPRNLRLDVSERMRAEVAALRAQRGILFRYRVAIPFVRH